MSSFWPAQITALTVNPAVGQICYRCTVAETKHFWCLVVNVTHFLSLAVKTHIFVIQVGKIQVRHHAFTTSLHFWKGLPHSLCNTCLPTQQITHFCTYKNPAVAVSFYYRSNITSNIIMLMQHYPTIMSWLGCWPFLTSQQLAQGFSRCPRQLAHTFMRRHSGVSTCVLRRTLAALVCLVAMVTQNSAHFQICERQMTNWVFIFLKYRYMLGN